MNIEERQNLMKKIIADLELLTSKCWDSDTIENLEKALYILKLNERLEGYDD